MKALLFTDMNGDPLMVNGDAVYKAEATDRYGEKLHTWIRFDNGYDTFVQESVEEVYKAIVSKN